MDSLYDTLWALSEAVEEFYDVLVPVIYGGISYGETLRLDIEPETARQKWLHVIITRLESGRYELVSYRL